MDRKGLLRFARYLAVGVSTFLLDLGLLFLAVHFGRIPYYIATPCAFLIAVSLNYALSREIVFRGTERKWHHGYVYFATVALGGAALTTTLVTLLVSQLGLFYLLARIIVAGIVGMGNYLFNLHLNFKIVGKHH
jgi:putative flippase GtrA